jgi:hypothetical protein
MTATSGAGSADMITLVLESGCVMCTLATAAWWFLRRPKVWRSIIKAKVALYVRCQRWAVKRRKSEIDHRVTTALREIHSTAQVGTRKP